MDTLTVWVAKYLIYVLVAGFAAVWLFVETRRGRLELTVAAIVGLILCGIFILVAGHVHNDPRPFVGHPDVHPLFAHSADNGFPSDHSVAGGLIATLVLARHRLLGLAFGVGAVGIGAARVAAQVHHVQDIVGGLLLGALAAAIGLLVAGPCATWLTERFSARARP